jgi:predicted RNase H-like HicB family nuclease
MGMAHDLAYTAVFEEVEGGWTQARIAEIPGVITAGESRGEARELLQDALREYLASFMEPIAGLDEVEDREQLVVELIAAPEAS